VSEPDLTARRRIADDLGTTLFVEAGAGSGKTTALVGRITALVATGTAELGSIAAITFTEKAAAELRDRVRRAMEEGAAGPDPLAAGRCRLALDQLDTAAIGTLHAFAQRLLSEHPVEARLPPAIEVLDEVSSGVQFDRDWAVFLDGLLADPTLQRTLQLLFTAGVRPPALATLASAFDANWDLIEERVPDAAPDPPSLAAQIEPALAAIDRACAAAVHCTDDGDKLLARLEEFADWAADLRRAGDDVDLLELLAARPSLKNVGRAGNWGCDIGEIKREIGEAAAIVEAARDRIGDACARQIATRIRDFTLRASHERRSAGRLAFHDLLVLARSLLRDPVHGPRVRTHLHRRYQRLLLDEFQDTDPIQIDLAVRIAASDPASAATGTDPWWEVPLNPGQLFVVGDPKQSIYRFRRADIATFLQARDRLGDDGAGLVRLTANFRTVGPVIDWVNRVFGTLMTADAGDDPGVATQPAYVALNARRPPPADGPAVAVLGPTPHPNKTPADGLRAAEAADVVATISRAVGERWSVEEPAGSWRPARLGDIAILVPARTSLPFLEDALQTAGIGYRAEASSLVYATRAVRDLLMVLRAVDDPTDHLRVVSALRTPLLGCGDDDLFRFRVEHGGRWSYLADQPATVPADDPVRAALAWLGGVHEQRQWQAPSELLLRIASDRRAFELGVPEGRARDVWRRLRFVIDQARAWTEATGGGLREYLQWVDRQTAEGARVAESVLPETDDDAVRIMTIHAAKGLEFPITIVSGLSTAQRGSRSPVQVVFDASGGAGIRLATNVSTDEYDAWKPIDEQMDLAERIRLLYVACTRARDHLVVSLHRATRATAPVATSRTNAELLLLGLGGEPDGLPEAAAGAVALAVPPPSTPAPPLPFAEWAAERAAALARASQVSTVAATALTDEGTRDAEPVPDPGLQKRPRDLDLPPWLKGRYGTAVGRAVHGVLQTIDLASGDPLDAAVAAQCEAEAVADREEDVRRLVLAALASPSVREAARLPHWREVYVCTPLSGRLLEGYVDLLYRRPDGLVVVDHKTAATSSAAELDRRVAGYRRQGSSYALAIEAVTGEAVVRVTFLFLTPDGPVERHLEDLAAAVEEIRLVMASGGEVLTP